MQNREIYVTEFDLRQLSELFAGIRLWNKKDREYLINLEEELERANVVSSRDIPADVVTMNSQVRIRGLDAGKETVVTLVFPANADYEQGKLSILAPMGTALLGYRAGDTIEWQAPAGLRRLRVEQVLYQPEAAGDYHL
jgi:regulator of nucleoside diphosphate kinase